MTKQELIEREELLEDILDALEDGDIEEVEDLADDAIEQFPKEAFGYFYLGESLFLQTEYEEALENFQKAVELAKDNSDYKARIALMYSKLSQNKEAKRIYKNILENNDTHISSLVSLAVLELNDRNETAALQYLNKALDVDADYVEAYKIRSIVHQAIGAYPAALADLDNVLLTEKNDTDLWMQKIALHDLLGQLEKAKDAFEEWIALDTADYNRLAIYGGFLITKEEYAAAEVQYTQAIEKEIYGEFAAITSFLNRGWARLHQDKLDLAFTDFRKVCNLEPAIGEAYIGIAEVKSKQNDFETAIDFIQLGSGIVFNDLWLLYDKEGELFTATQNWDSAQKAYQNNIDSSDQEIQAEGYYSLGNMFLIKGDLDAAFEAWTQASSLYHPYADTKIKEHCPSQMQEAIIAKETALFDSMKDDINNNQNSKILAPLFDKIWKTDTKTTTAKNKVFASLPKDIAEKVMTLLGNVCLGLSDRGVFLLNPNKDGTRMVYTIQTETTKEVTIVGIPLDGAAKTTFTIATSANKIIIRDFGEEQEGVNLYMEAVSANKLPAITKKALQKELKTGNINFMGEAFKAIIQ